MYNLDTKYLRSNLTFKVLIQQSQYRYKKKTSQKSMLLILLLIFYLCNNYVSFSLQYQYIYDNLIVMYYLSLYLCFYFIKTSPLIYLFNVCFNLLKLVLLCVCHDRQYYIIVENVSYKIYLPFYILSMERMSNFCVNSLHFSLTFNINKVQ